MIDVHSHVLPGLDDGAKNDLDLIAMARAAVKDGITRVIATPHHANGSYDNEAGVVLDAVERANALLQQESIPLRLGAGQEVRLYRELVEDYHEGKLLTLAGSKYLLLEFPSGRVPSGADEMVHELAVIGITPIIAHPERNMELAGNPERLRQLIELGALTQVTTHSLLGVFGKKIASLSVDWCKQQLVHVIASDAHDPSYRCFGLQGAYEMIEARVSREIAEYCRLNAERIWLNEPIEALVPVLARKPWYLRWKS